MNPLLLIILQNIVVPEISKFIQEYYNTNGTWPTREEMEKKATDLANDIINQGNAFLNLPPESENK